MCLIAPNRDLTATNRGDLRHPRLRHADDTPTEGFAWRKTPAIPPGVRLSRWCNAVSLVQGCLAGCR